MSRFAADHGLDVLGIGAVFYHLTANLETNLGDHSQDISLRRVTGGPHDEVGAANA
jgi:hypothetical protein